MGRRHRVTAVAVAVLLASACGGGQAGSGGKAGSPSATHLASPSASKAARAAAATSAQPAGQVSSPASAASPLPRPTSVASPGPGEGVVSVVALNGYVEWGGTDPKVNWVGEFERRTGCKVSLRFYDPGYSDQPDGLDPASFDVISAPPQVAGRLIADQRVAPITTTLLPEYDSIPRRLRELATHGDQVYGVPYLWAVTNVLYDADKVRSATPGSIFDARGPVLFRDHPFTLADAALVLKDRGMDIGDPFELSPAQLDAATKLVAGSDRRLFWRDPLDVVRWLVSGEVRLAQGTPYHLSVLTEGPTSVRAVKHRPVTGWLDSWMVSAQAAHPTCAYRWLDWTSSAEVQRKASAWTGLAPANPAACTGRARRVCASYHAGEPEAFRDVAFAVWPTAYDQWIDRWSDLTR